MSKNKDSKTDFLAIYNELGYFPGGKQYNSKFIIDRLDLMHFDDEKKLEKIVLPSGAKIVIVNNLDLTDLSQY